MTHPAGGGLRSSPPGDGWIDWAELDADRQERRYVLVPTICGCGAGCGVLAYVDRDTLEVRKCAGNPEHPGTRGRICPSGAALPGRLSDPERILYPLRRAGERGESRWRQVSWDEALRNIALRMRRSIVDGRQGGVLWHAADVSDDPFLAAIPAAFGTGGRASDTAIHSSGARAGYQFWMGHDQPSPDYANARVILVIGDPLDASGSIAHARRIVEARERGATLIVLDPRLSQTAAGADEWLAPYPGSEAAILLAIARHLVEGRLHDRAFMQRWWNWREYLEATDRFAPKTLEAFEQKLLHLYERFTFEFAARQAGVPADQIRLVAERVAGAGNRLATHVRGASAAGGLGGWQVARCLFLLNALLGAVGSEGGVDPGAWHRFTPPLAQGLAADDAWSPLAWPVEYPLARGEMSFLLPYLLQERRGSVDVLITQGSNPVGTAPDGFAWMEALRDASKVGLHVALTPTWNETAQLADYVLPVGHAVEGHELVSRATHDSRWLAFRQPAVRVAREYTGHAVADTRGANPGEVWEEFELWVELAWRVDPDGGLGVRRHFESRERPGRKLTVDEHYGSIFERSIPGLPERAGGDGLSPLQYMRRHGVFEIAPGARAPHEQPVPREELVGVRRDLFGRIYSHLPMLEPSTPLPANGPEPCPVGVDVDGEVVRGFPTPSGRLEFYSSELAARGWPEHTVPGYIESHVHSRRLGWDQVPLLMVGASAVPGGEAPRLWINPRDAARWGGIHGGDLVRVETEIGYFVVRSWVTEGIRPGVVACSQGLVRRSPLTPSDRPAEEGDLLVRALVSLEQDGSWRRLSAPEDGGEPATNPRLAFAVHPDPVSGMNCWHQAVRVRRVEASDRDGDLLVDVEKARAVYERWLAMSRPAGATGRRIE